MVSVMKIEGLEEQNLDQRIDPVERAMTAVMDDVDDLTGALAMLVSLDRKGAFDPQELARHQGSLNALRLYLGEVAYRLSQETEPTLRAVD